MARGRPGVAPVTSSSGPSEGPEEAEEAELRTAIRDFARSEVLPGAAARDASGEFPAQLVERLAELDAMGIAVPRAYGGLGQSTRLRLAAIEEVAAADAALASIYTAHYLAMEVLLVGADEAQKLRHLPGMAEGQRLGAFALTEPGAGSDIGSMEATAQISAEGWLLKGSKTFISNAREAGLLLVFAKTNPTLGFRGISCFAVDRASPNLSFSTPQDKCGLRSSPTYTVFLDGVEVAADGLIGTVGGGGKIALEALNRARIDSAAMACGIAARALELASSYALSRQQFGHPISEFQVIQLGLGEMQALLQVSRLAAREAARLKDQGANLREAASIAKYVAAENCFRVVDRALQIHGGAGFMRESEIERLYRDCRVLRIYEGTSEIQLLTIASQVLRRADGVA